MLKTNVIQCDCHLYYTLKDLQSKGINIGKVEVKCKDPTVTPYLNQANLENYKSKFICSKYFFS